MASMVGAVHRDGKEELESDFGATFHIAHTRAGMAPYKKTSPGTTVEVADRTILSVYEFGTIEVDPDQPGSITKPVKMVAVVRRKTP